VDLDCLIREKHGLRQGLAYTKAVSKALLVEC